jgi:O-acetyl-ADP-ribose deacetylase (regulator of RNase III)
MHIGSVHFAVVGLLVFLAICIVYYYTIINMITFITGNLLESNAQALINTVNTLGVMGKGIALQFKNEFTHNFKVYANACKNKEFNVGDLLIIEDSSLIYGTKLIINFPTKTDWRKPSEYEYIEIGIKKLALLIQEKNIKSIAIPHLGCGNGCLDWSRVKCIIVDNLIHVNCAIQIYEPNYVIKEILKQEKRQNKL